MAFHVANNVFVTTVNVLLAGGGPLVVDRSASGGGGAALIVPAVAMLGVLAFVGLRERSRRTDADLPVSASALPAEQP